MFRACEWLESMEGDYWGTNSSEDGGQARLFTLLATLETTTRFLGCLFDSALGVLRILRRLFCLGRDGSRALGRIFLRYSCLLEALLGFASVLLFLPLRLVRFFLRRLRTLCPGSRR